MRSLAIIQICLFLVPLVWGCGEDDEGIEPPTMLQDTYSVSFEPGDLDVFGPLAFVLEENAPMDASDVDGDTRSLPEYMGATVYATEASRTLALMPADQSGSILEGGMGWLILRWRADVEVPDTLGLIPPPEDGPPSSSRLGPGEAFGEYYVAPGVYVPVDGTITLNDNVVDYYADDNINLSLSVAFDDVRIEADGQTHVAATDSWVTVYGDVSPEAPPTVGGGDGDGVSGPGGSVPYTFTCEQTGSSHTVDVPLDGCVEQSKAFAKAFGCNEIDSFSSTCVAYYTCITPGDPSGIIAQSCP